jgi:hypothetical protein
MIKSKLVLCSALIAGLLAGCSTEKHSHDKQAKLETEAKVSRADAEKIALSKVPGGTIKEGELEKEKGKLIWSFDISTTGTKDIMEVNIDAISGAVIAVDKETAADEAKEKKKEEKEEDEKEKK